MKGTKCFAVLAAVFMLASVLFGCNSTKSGGAGSAAANAQKCGVILGDSFQGFSILEQSSVTDVTVNADGSVSYIATAAGGAGGGVAFYVKADKTEINIANYESIDIELDYAPVEGAWNAAAQNPGFALRILPWDSTGIFGGYEDMEYFDSDALSGTLKKTVVVPENFAEKIKSSSDYDSILGFGIKFNDYQRGNTDGDKLAVTVKSVKFNKKAAAPADKAFDDGLTDAQRGSVVSISYPTKDYAAGANAASYEKHAWVYLPAGYDAADTATKYPVFVLLHGFGQNENTWGLTDKGRGGKIKGYMDRGMASGDVKKFILVVANGIASASWGPNGAGMDFNGFNVFGGELRNDLLPYMRANFNVADGRENVALAGLSMGGGQTFTIGMGECLDLVSYFGAFSAALFGTSEEFIAGVEAKFPDYKINQLYMICGDADGLVYGTFPGYVDALSKWSKIAKFDSEVYEGGTHDFPVWYRGFNHFIPMLFK